MPKSIKKIIKSKGHVAYGESWMSSQHPNTIVSKGGVLEVPEYVHLTKGERKSLMRNKFQRTVTGGYQKNEPYKDMTKYISSGSGKARVTNKHGKIVQTMAFGGVAYAGTITPERIKK